MEGSWPTILPPLVAIALALVTRKVLPALGLAIVLGALLGGGFAPLPSASRLGGYLLQAVSGWSHWGILSFSLLLGGMLGVTRASGEQERLARLMQRYATTPLRSQLATWFLGLLIFFDDYLNSLLVGSAMRPIFDRHRISREKLAFLVDATAAPVVSLAVVSSWIAVEVGYITEQYAAVGLPADGLVVFMQSLPYRFYPWLMLVFGLAVALSGRDFGPMLRAERVARQAPRTSDISPAPAHADIPHDAPAVAESGRRLLLSALPLVLLVLAALLGMWLDGYLQCLSEGVTPTGREVFSRSRSHLVLVGAALIGNFTALPIAHLARGEAPGRLAREWLAGARRMLEPCAILFLAWALSSVCKDLQTASYLITFIGDGLSPQLLPAAIFVLAGATSFATGTSWGTMAILFPLVVPLAHGLSPGDEGAMLGAVSSILAGAVWGDHCSPISDTTIMSSLASGCDHIAHVRTQLPYALAVGGVSLTLGDLATGYGWLSPAAALLLGSLLLVGLLFALGKPATARGGGSTARRRS